MPIANKTTKLNRNKLGAFALLSALPLALAAQPSELEALRAQIAELEQRFKILERNQELEKEAADAAAKARPNVVAGPSGFILEAQDKSWSVRARANVQLDGRYFIEDGGANNNDRFLLRRVRPSLEGTVGSSFTFRIMPDFAPSSVDLLDAWGNYKFSDQFNILFGKTKSPIGLERLVSQTNLAFIERGHPTSLLPNRDLGVQFHGKVLGGLVDWNASILNGTTDGQSNNSSGQPDDDFEFAGRLFSHPFAKSDSDALKGLGVGLAATYGNQDNVAPSAYRTTAQTSVFSWNNNVRVDGTVARLSPQLYYYYGPIGLLAEFAVSEQDLVRTDTAARDTLSNTAWQVYATYVLTGEDASYGGVRPLTNFSIKEGTWGAWELAARYGELDIDNDAFVGSTFSSATNSVSKIKSATLGVNWYWNRNFKVSVNYDHSVFEGGAAGGDRDDEQAIFSRFQLQF